MLKYLLLAIITPTSNFGINSLNSHANMRYQVRSDAIDKIYLFNPETEILLGSDSSMPVTLPKSVTDFISRLLLLPAIYAEIGSGILIWNEEPENLPYHSLLQNKNLTAIRTDDLIDFSGEIIPWGWNKALRNRLLSLKVRDTSLPTENFISDIRQLTHRRSSIQLNKDISYYAPELVSNTPKECFSVEECISYASGHNGAYYKSPWSSSGRGVFKTGKFLTDGELKRVESVIRKQGSIMAEKIFPGIFNFATEWMIEKDSVAFKGISFFNTSGGGKYEGNLLVSEQEGYEILKTISSVKSGKIIEAQRYSLHTLLSGKYVGPAGIDMMADSSGNVCGCVELNLRMTMGHVALHARNLFPEKKVFIPGY